MDFVHHSAWKQPLLVPILAILCLSLTLTSVDWINSDMLVIKSNINWLIGLLARASLNTAKSVSPFQRSEIAWPQSGQITINSLVDYFIKKCVFLGSFKHNFNIKWIKGSKKREKGGNVSHVQKNKKANLRHSERNAQNRQKSQDYFYSCLHALFLK